MPQTATEPIAQPARPGSRDHSLRTWRAARHAARRAQPGPITLPDLPARTMQVPTSSGLVHVREVGPSDAPVLLFVHGLLVDGHLWDLVAQELSGEFRCVMPDLPLGSHRIPLDAAADRTPSGQAALVGELVAWTGADDVTLVASDSGVAITQLLMDQGAPGVRRVVLATGDCFDHFFPPGFRIYQYLARAPVLLRAMLASARVGLVRSSPLAYGGLTHRSIDDAVLRQWLLPARANRAIIDDTVGFLLGVSADELTAAAERLDRFERPVLLAWAPEQRWFPIEHADRLAAILPDARIAEITASGAFPALDQPAELARLVRTFTA